jgi:hypothetical protein
MTDAVKRTISAVAMVVAGALAACGGCDGMKMDGASGMATPSAKAGGAAARPAEESKPGGLFGAMAGGGAGKPIGTAENYTILLRVFRNTMNAGHVAEARRWKEETEKNAKWKDLFIVHRDDHSMLYWGRFRWAQDAEGDLKKAKGYVSPSGVRVYPGAILMPMPGKEAEQVEYRLDGAPKEAVFTVLLAIFYDVPEAEYVGRKQFALDYCRQLREEGLPAFYRHGENQSVVTVGAFAASAVAKETKDGKATHIARDETVKAIFRRFPDLAVNGNQRLIWTVNQKTGKYMRVPDSTYLVVIPREKGEEGVGAGAAPAAGGPTSEPAAR